MPLFAVKRPTIAHIGDYEFDTAPISDNPLLEQIYPAGAENNPGYLAKITDFDEWGCEEKFDGERLVLTFEKDCVRATTRRQSVKTGLLNEKSNNVPHLRNAIIADLEGTVIDGEIIATVQHRTLGLTQSIMNSLPEKSVALQRNYGWVKYKAFDCLKYKGEDIRGRKEEDRRVFLSTVIGRILERYPDLTGYIEKAEKYPAKNYQEIFKRITDAGGEGCILKKKSATYGATHAWLKVKREETFDAFVTGYEKGNGKYSDTVGYLRCSVYDDEGNEVEICRVAPGDDKTRNSIYKNFESYKGRVVELKAQEVTKFNRLRHPRIVRWREDIGQADCTLRKLLQQKSEE